MQGPARVLIVGEDGGGDALAEALSACGFESTAANLTQAAAEVSGSRRPDVVILNACASEASASIDSYLAFAQTLKQSALSSRMRIMLVGLHRDSDLSGLGNIIDDLLIGDLNSVQICHRTRSLIRLNTMHEELVRRLGTSAKYGLDAPPPIAPPISIENATVLVLGDATDFGTIESALAARSTLIGALSANTAFDYLKRRDFDAVIVNAGADVAAYLDFVRDVRRNSRLYNLPLVMLVDPGALDDAEYLYSAGISDAVTKPYSPQELQLRVDTLVRESRFRDSLRSIYDEAKHYATSDALTGLYNRGFLLEHLASVIADAGRTSQSVSLAAVTVANMAEINSMLGYARGDRVLRQVGETIGMLIRGEDLACRFSGCKFTILLPDTPVERAGVAVNRINGVISNTGFAVENHYHPISVSLVTGVAGLEKDDTAESLVARCWNIPLRAAA